MSLTFTTKGQPSSRHNPVLSRRELRKRVLHGPRRFAVVDEQFNEVLVYVQETYNNGTSVRWTLVCKTCHPSGMLMYDESINDFIDYLDESKARQHWTVDT